MAPIPLASTYTGSIHFTSSDPAAGLPDDYQFAAAEGGAHAFTVTLQTPGLQSIAATDVDDSGLTGEAQLFVTPV